MSVFPSNNQIQRPDADADAANQLTKASLDLPRVDWIWLNYINLDSIKLNAFKLT